MIRSTKLYAIAGLIAACCAFLSSAQAASITLTCPDAAVTSTGPNFTIVCGPGQSTNPPGPTPPPGVVTPVPPPSQACAGAPVISTPLKITNVVTGQIGQTFTWKIPKASGIASVVNEGRGAPLELQTEISISKCPGDTAYYLTEAAKVAQSARGGKQVVCGADGPFPSIKWNQPGGCVIPAGETWYLNVRLLSGGQPGVIYSVSLGIAL